MSTTTLTAQDLFIQTTLLSWESALGQATSLFDKISDEDLLQSVVPGKNRGIYLLGHLVAVHDRMFPLLGLGDRLYPHLDETFVTSPDNPAATIPSAQELRKAWTTVNQRLNTLLRDWSPEEWLQKHTAISDDDFAKEPHRNRLSVVLSRTRHVAYHAGQLAWFKK
jgi:hypothetical protein